MNHPGIKFNKKTERYYIDTSFRLVNGKTFHFKFKTKDEKFKNLNYVRRNYFAIIDQKKNSLNNSLKIQNHLLKFDEKKINKISITTVAQLLDTYIEYRGNQLRKFTIKKYRQIVLQNIVKLTNDLESFLSIEFLLSYRKFVLSKNVSNDTKKVYLYVAKELIFLSRKLQIITSDKRDDLLAILDNNLRPEIKQVSRNKYTSIEDANKVFLVAKNEHDKALFVLLYYSSLRIGEFLGIKIKDIRKITEINNDFYYEIRIERQKYQSGEVVPFLKNSIKFKYIYFYNQAAQVLEHYLASTSKDVNDFLFNISRKTVSRRLNKAMCEAGVQHNTLHGFGRKSINTELYKAGADTKTRAALLGQSSLDINEIYYIDHDEAINKVKNYLKRLD